MPGEAAALGLARWSKIWACLTWLWSQVWPAKAFAAATEAPAGWGLAGGGLPALRAPCFGACLAAAATVTAPLPSQPNRQQSCRRAIRTLEFVLLAWNCGAACLSCFGERFAPPPGLLHPLIRRFVSHGAPPEHPIVKHQSDISQRHRLPRRLHTAEMARSSPPKGWWRGRWWRSSHLSEGGWNETHPKNSKELAKWRFLLLECRT